MAGRKNQPGWVERLKPIPNPEGAADQRALLPPPQTFLTVDPRLRAKAESIARMMSEECKLKVTVEEEGTMLALRAAGSRRLTFPVLSRMTSFAQGAFMGINVGVDSEVFNLKGAWKVRFAGQILKPDWQEKGPAAATLSLLLAGKGIVTPEGNVKWHVETSGAARPKIANDGDVRFCEHGTPLYELCDQCDPFRFLAGWDYQPEAMRAQWLARISDATNPAIFAAASSLPWMGLPESTRMALLELAAQGRPSAPNPAPARSGPARACYLIEVYPYDAAEPDSMTCYLTAGELGEIEDDLTELRDDTESIESFTITEAPDESTLQQVRAWVHAFREREQD